MQGLREVRLDLHFTRANRFASSAAKGGQEIGAGIAISDLHRPRAARQSLEFIPGFGDLADAVEENLGTQAADARFGKVPVIERVGIIGAARELISPR